MNNLFKVGDKVKLRTDGARWPVSEVLNYYSKRGKPLDVDAVHTVIGVSSVDDMIETDLAPNTWFAERFVSVALTGMKTIDVRGVEEWREYVYDTGLPVRIEKPATVYTKEGSLSHRVTDVEGVSYYVPSGWRYLRWKGPVIA